MFLWTMITFSILLTGVYFNYSYSIQQNNKDIEFGIDGIRPYLMRVMILQEYVLNLLLNHNLIKIDSNDYQFDLILFALGNIIKAT
jgi:hypothetical protein